jgi:hypothetical protein
MCSPSSGWTGQADPGRDLGSRGRDGLASASLHDRGDIFIAEPQVLTDERARDDAGGGFGLQPGFAHLEYSGCLGWSVELTCHYHHT